MISNQELNKKFEMVTFRADGARKVETIKVTDSLKDSGVSMSNFTPKIGDIIAMFPMDEKGSYPFPFKKVPVKGSTSYVYYVPCLRGSSLEDLSPSYISINSFRKTGVLNRDTQELLHVNCPVVNDMLKLGNDLLRLHSLAGKGVTCTSFEDISVQKFIDGRPLLENTIDDEGVVIEKTEIKKHPVLEYIELPDGLFTQE